MIPTSSLRGAGGDAAIHLPAVRRHRKLDCFVATLLAMTACVTLTSCLTPTGKQQPAALVNYGSTGGAGSAGMHTVLAGDTVYTISQKYNLPLRDIISLNQLSPPYQLPNGYRINLPPPNEYKVKTGDTLNGISRLFGVSVSETARLNNLSAPFVVSRGQTLRLPSAQPKLEQSFSMASAPSFSATSETAVAAPVPSIESVSLAPPPGQGALPPGAQPGMKTLAQPGFPPQPSPLGAPQAMPPAQAQTVSVALPQAIAPKVPPRSGSGRFMRPVDGKVVSSYGPKDDGLHNDGINIKAAKGTPVRAAENGVIAYVGNGMSGYGNLVLIRHADRWMTAYAHMDKTLVKKGDTVKAGQSIGTVGNSGTVDSAQLHFEVRKGTQAVDPSKYL